MNAAGYPYPDSPKSVPKHFTRVSMSYRLKTLAVLLGIVFFVIIYLAMVTGAGYLLYYTVTYPIGRVSRLSLLLKIAFIILAGMLFLFLVKFVFKRGRYDDPFQIEIKEVQHPGLFKFIRQLCRETGAPFPKRIFISHDVNAGVFYNNTFFSLFLPVKKSLLIGIGLVNFLNLSEFKAILAHEFGHFAQSSMKLGSYIYVANRIIHDMVFSRDRWDDTLAAWKKSESTGLIIAAVLLQAVIGILRVFLRLFYLVLNVLHASLSRQMEHHADLVAVSVTSSDAVTNALVKTQIAERCFSFAQNHLGDASDHKLFSKNIFFHQSKALEQLKRYNPNVVHFFSAKSNSKKMIFSKAWDFTPSMYDQHPSNYERELKIKRVYIENTEDNRRPQELFSNYQGLCERLTHNLYKNVMVLPSDAVFSDPEKVDGFIEAELQETHYDAKYWGAYDDRWLTPINLDSDQIKNLKLKADIEEKNILMLLDEIYGEQLKEKMKNHFQKREDLDRVSRVLSGESRSKTFQIGYVTYKASQAERIYRKLMEQMDTDNKWFESFDIKVFLTHLRILEESNIEQKHDFLARYRFHFALQGIFIDVQILMEEIHGVLDEMMRTADMDEETFETYAGKLCGIRSRFAGLLDAANDLKMPGLKHMDMVSSVKQFLLKREPVVIDTHLLDDVAIKCLLDQLDLVIIRLRRLYFKSLGGILVLQESISDQYLLNAFSVRGN